MTDDEMRRASAPSREPTSTELLCMFERGIDRYRCELRDHGHWGVEVQFFKNGALMHSRLLDTRDEAITWAHAQHQMILASWGVY